MLAAKSVANQVRQAVGPTTRRALVHTGSSKSEIDVSKSKEGSDATAIGTWRKPPPSYSKSGSRSSYNGLVATVFNGTSRVGSNVISRLGKIGTQLVIAYRDDRYFSEKLRVVGDLGQVYFAQYHLKDEKSLLDAIEHSNVVVNLIGKQNETKNFSFEDVHIEGPRRLARLAKQVGVEKFIHISALNCNPNPEPQCLKEGSQFYRTKYYGELAVREEFPEAIIFRPSDVYGETDNFMNYFTSMQRSAYTRSLPIWDYYFEVEKQPVFMKDLVTAIVNSIFDESAIGKTYQAVGPYRYNFYDLIEYMRACSAQGQKYNQFEITNLRWNFFMRAAITLSEKLQKYPPTTWERVERDLTSDYVDPKLPTIKDLGVDLTAIEFHILRHGNYRPREIKVEIPYGFSVEIEKPKRLNELIV